MDFFGLSAYLLTSKLRQQLALSPRGQTIARYLCHRFFRIYPLFTLVLLVHLVVGDIDSISVLRHLALIEGWGELWAISTEFQFYLLLPLIAVMPRNLALGAVLLGAVLSICYTVREPQTVTAELSLLPKAVPFALAAALAIWKPTGRHGAVASIVGLFMLCAVTVVFRYVHTSPEPAVWTNPWMSLALGFAVSALIYAALQPCWLSRLLSFRVLVWIGEISFSLYLLHMFVVRSFSALELPAYLAGWLALLCALGLATLSYRLIEVPGIRVGRSMAARVGVRPDTAPPLPRG